MTEKCRERMACGREELLVSVLYGEASAAEREAFEAHRRECAACDEEMQAFARVRDELGGWEIDAIPHIKVEVRPSMLERLRQALALLPTTMRLAAAGACALLLLAVFNTEISVGQNGVSFRTALWSQPAPPPVVAGGPQLSKEQIDQMISERVDQSVRAQMVAYKAEMEEHLKDMQTLLVSTQNDDDIKRLTVQVAAQRKRIEALQKDLDRTAGYGGSDLFSAVLTPAEPGS